MKPASKGSDRLPRKKLLRLGIALALGTAALDASGAGLGRLNVLSAIGQPLRAEIELTAVSREEAATLTARLASPDTFAQANIDYGSVLSTLRFSIQRRANGNPYVLVTSSQLVNEPFLDVLVELNSGTGRLVREYTVLLDPPDARTGQRSVEPGSTVLQAQAPAAETRAPVPRRAAPVPAPSAAAVSAPPASSGGGTSSGDYVVQSGDTALSIARANKPDGVTLEQMLAALYRDNPQAFNGNVNRLLAGATMKLPAAASVQAVDGAEARRLVAQSANFSSYRERIARNAATTPSTRAAGEQASGRLSTRVEDSAAPASEAKDRLQLSRPETATKAAPATGATRSGTGGPSLEDLAAKDRELQETKTRLALLEKNVADLQQLLTLKNQTLADLQKPGAATTLTTTTTTTAPSPTPAPASVAPTPVPVAVPVAAPVTPPVAAAPPPAPVAAPAPAPVKTAPLAASSGTDAQGSWFDSLKENTLLLVGLIVVVLLLIGYGVYMVGRRRKLSRFEDSIFVDNSVLHANSVFGTTGGQSVDTANSGFHSNFVPVAGNLPEQNEVDPVAEADVYIAYGRDAQAEEILKEALRADGTRQAVRLKLLEIYAKRGDAKTFETMANELYAATGGQGDEWKQAAHLGATIDPHNPMYAEVPVADGAVVPPRPPTALPSPAAMPTRAQAATRDASAIGQGLAFAATGAAAGFAASAITKNEPAGTGVPSATATELMRTDPMPRADANGPTAAPAMDLDFDLGFANTGLSPLSAPAADAPSRGDDGLDFDVGANGTKPLVDPFTASAFGAGDASARTAVNLPAFRARAAQEPAPRPESDGFTASDIFGSSIVAETEVMASETPHDSPAPTPTPTPQQARTMDFRQVVDSNQFDKTEPLDAFSKINLELDQDGFASTDIAPDYGQKTDVWQAMATKLDLALAYSDIGDKEGARELLEEVVRNGDPAQSDRARQLIGELG